MRQSAVFSIRSGPTWPESLCPQDRPHVSGTARTTRPSPARQALPHGAFRELILDDETTRSEASSAQQRARAAGLDPSMRIKTRDELTDVSYDRQLMDLTSLRFTDAGHAVQILGPVGVGKTHPVHALGHTPVRRRMSVRAARATSSPPACAPPGWTTPTQLRSGAGPRRSPHPRRLRPAPSRHHRDQRLLRAGRRTTPQGHHHSHLELGPLRVASHDKRHPSSRNPQSTAS